MPSMHIISKTCLWHILDKTQHKYERHVSCEYLLPFVLCFLYAMSCMLINTIFVDLCRLPGQWQLMLVWRHLLLVWVSGSKLKMNAHILECWCVPHSYSWCMPYSSRKQVVMAYRKCVHLVYYCHALIFTKYGIINLMTLLYNHCR